MSHILHAATGPARSWGLQNGRGFIETSCIWAGGAYSAPQTSWCQSNYSSEAQGKRGLARSGCPASSCEGLCVQIKPGCIPAWCKSSHLPERHGRNMRCH